MAAGDPIVAFGTTRTLEASGAAITSGSVVQADDLNYSIVTHGASWPDAIFVLKAAFASAPTEGRVLNLLARPKNVDGANHSPAPEATRPTYFVGSFVVDNVTSDQYLLLNGGLAYDLPIEADYYVHNAADATVSAGWTLKVTPRNVVPATS